MTALGNARWIYLVLLVHWVCQGGLDLNPIFVFFRKTHDFFEPLGVFYFVHMYGHCNLHAKQ